MIRRPGRERVLHRRNGCSRKKGGGKVGKTKRGNGNKIMAVADRRSLPLAVSTQSTSPAEVTHVDATLAARATRTLPRQLIGDKGYDSDGLDRRLRVRGIEMIAPQRSSRRSDRRTQDGRVLRRCRRRWKVERLFACLGNYRRLVVRYERHHENFTTYLQLACCMILVR